MRRYEALHEMLLPYVEKDPTAFCTADQFTAACETLQEAVRLRAESVRRQLDGELAGVTEEQAEKDRVDTTDLDLYRMAP